MTTSILVVEDEPAIQELLRLNLEDAGFAVSTVAGRGERAGADHAVRCPT